MSKVHESSRDKIKKDDETLYQRITELESQLKECESRYRLFVEHASDGIYRTDAKGRFTYFNQTAGHLLKYQTDELLGHHYSEMLPESHRKFVEQFYGTQFLNRTRNTYNEIPILAKDGSIVWLGQNVQLTVENGEPTGFQAIARDITARRNAEEALRVSEEKFSKAFWASPNVMSLTSLEDGRYVEVNDSFLDISGYTSEEVLGKTIRGLKFWVDKSDPIEIMRELRLRGSVRNMEVRIRIKSGDIRICLLSVELIEIGGSSFALSVGSDITERKNADSVLRSSLEKLRMSIDMIIDAMALTVESRDPYTAGHQRRVANLARAIASEMSLSSSMIDGIRMAGVIHDLGKISIPAEILSKPGKLSDIEFNLIKVHPQAGYDILKRIEFPWPVADIVFQHHERLDGSGYPQALKQDDIIIEAKILAVADVVEAIASHRPYRSSLGIDNALNEIKINRGVLYDSQAVDACLALFTEGRFNLD